MVLPSDVARFAALGSREACSGGVQAEKMVRRFGTQRRLLLLCAERFLCRLCGQTPAWDVRVFIGLRFLNMLLINRARLEMKRG